MKRSRRPWTLLVVGAFAALALPHCSPPKPTPRADVSSGRRILLVGLDAADWLAVDALADQGRLPTFDRLRRRGQPAVLVATPPLVSPLIWTTIATGRQPEDHGVLDFMSDVPGGGQAPVSSEARRVPALWNLFTLAERTVGVVGWWASAPAERVNGTLVSDALAPQLLRRSAAPDAQAVFPASAWPLLAKAVTAPQDVTRAELEHYVPVDAAAFARAQLALAEPAGQGRLYSDRVAHLAAVVASTRTHAALAERLLTQGQPDLMAVYLESIDTLSHLFVRERYGAAAIAQAYVEADRVLARLAAACTPDTLVVVTSDHGFLPADAGVHEDPAGWAGPATAWHRPYGLFAVIEAGTLSDALPTSSPRMHPRAHVTPLDVAPTVLHAAGLAVGLEMPGQVALTLLPPDVSARTVKRARTPPRPASESASASSRHADPDALARLQALGYVGASPSSLARQNLGESLYRRGRWQAAERELRAVVESQPKNLAAHLWLAQALREQGQSAPALRVYEAALALPGADGEALVVAVELALGNRDLKRAQALLASRASSPRGPTGAAHLTARALIAHAQGKAREAERLLRAALRVEPASFEALARLFDLLLQQGRGRELPALSAAALRQAPQAARLVALHGEALLAAGDARGAADVLAEALALVPDGDVVRLDLGRAQLQSGQLDAALSTLTPAAAGPVRDALLGAVYASQRAWPQAIERYRAALLARPDDVPLINGLAWALRQQGAHEQARELFARSLALAPDQPEIRALIGPP